MTTALIYFGSSALVLIILSSLYLIEDIKGRRILLPTARNFFDHILASLLGSVVRSFKVMWHWIAQFVLSHGVSKLLSATMSYLRKLEQRVEDLVLHNRQAVKREKRERTHLDEIADHKVQSALSEEDKHRLKNE